MTKDTAPNFTFVPGDIAKTMSELASQLDTTKELLSKAEEKNQRLVKALENAYESLISQNADIEFYKENECLPTQNEVDMSLRARKSAAEALAANQGEME